MTVHIFDDIPGWEVFQTVIDKSFWLSNLIG